MPPANRGRVSAAKAAKPLILMAYEGHAAAPTPASAIGIETAGPTARIP